MYLVWWSAKKGKEGIPRCVREARRLGITRFPEQMSFIKREVMGGFKCAEKEKCNGRKHWTHAD